jgi:hypothetical protein
MTASGMEVEIEMGVEVQWDEHMAPQAAAVKS